jgi:hypothetical protein
MSAASGDLFMGRAAIVSGDGKYRYLLHRVWDAGKPRALFVMLNPSTADAEIDDPTIRSCIRLSKSWGYGSFEVVNLYAFRATDPRALAREPFPVGPDNSGAQDAAIERCDVVICAWGAHEIDTALARDLYDRATLHHPVCYCLGTTKSGAPKHPLYIATGAPLVEYRA